jgi:ATP-dependent Clp endopeptidase proteolytic subunit ClpP
MPDFPMPQSLVNAQVDKLNAERDYFKTQRLHEEMQMEQTKIDLRDTQSSNDENHLFAFYFPIGAQSSAYCMQTLGLWARRNPEKDKAFTIEIGSPGGAVLPGFALLDYIRDLRTQGYTINTQGFGEVASMAAVLLQAGEERALGENSYLLIHEPSAMEMGKLSELKDEAAFVERLGDRLASILAERSTLSARQIKNRWDRRDWWLDAEEALKLGFVDRLIK